MLNILFSVEYNVLFFSVEGGEWVEEMKHQTLHQDAQQSVRSIYICHLISFVFMVVRQKAIQ
jgi:hypothetical protein